MDSVLAKEVSLFRRSFVERFYCISLLIPDCEHIDIVLKLSMSVYVVTVVALRNVTVHYGMSLAGLALKLKLTFCQFHLCSKRSCQLTRRWYIIMLALITRRLLCLW